MESTIFLRIALPTPLRRLFDYLPPQPVDLKALVPGIRVLVPFQSRTLVGILIEVVQESSVPVAKLKQATAILDTTPLLPADLTQLCAWAADYYHYALGEVLSAALPGLLRKGKPVEVKKALTITETTPDQPLVLNAAQSQAVNAIVAAKECFKVFLLDGVTGSGKTEVYLQAIDAMFTT